MLWIARPLAALSAMGFLASLAAHLAGWMGLTLDSGVMLLHGGVFVVWLPAVMLFIRISRNLRPPQSQGWMSRWNRGDARWNVVLSGCPAWMRIGLYVVFAYAIVNFLLVATAAGTHVGPSEALPPATLRAFSGHWMVFYYTAFALAWSVLMKPTLLATPTCVKGHPMALGDRFCAECGSAAGDAKTG